mgnify:CR=1 FL=1
MSIYTNARYCTDDDGNNTYIKVSIEGIISFVPVDNENGDYKEIMRQVDAGELTIAEAD